MKKYITTLAIVLAVYMGTSAIVNAGVLTPSGRSNSGVLTPSLWTLSGLNLIPGNSSYIIGSSVFDGVFKSVTSPSISLTGSFSRPTTSTATSTTLTTSNYFVAVDAATSSVTVILPSATSSTGMEFVIKKVDASSTLVFVNTSTSTQTIDGAASSTISSQWASVSVISNGSNWLKK